MRIAGRSRHALVAAALGLAASCGGNSSQPVAPTGSSIWRARMLKCGAVRYPPYDTTGGATANPQTFALGGGWSYTVSRWIEYTANGQVIEDHGIAPSVAVPASAGDFQSGRDPVLDYAIARAALQSTSSDRRD